METDTDEPVQIEIELEPAQEPLVETTGTVVDELHSDVFPPFDTTTFAPQLVWLAITFAALYFLMSRVALPRIGTILETRKARIDTDLGEAEAARRKTEAAIAEYEAALEAARARSHALAAETRDAIKADIEAKRKAVETDLSAKLSEAEARVEKTKTAALANVDEIAAETVEALVAHLNGTITPAQARDAVAAAKE